MKETTFRCLHNKRTGSSQSQWSDLQLLLQLSYQAPELLLGRLQMEALLAQPLLLSGHGPQPPVALLLLLLGRVSEPGFNSVLSHNDLWRLLVLSA